MEGLSNLNGFVIVRESEDEAKQVLRDIVKNANIEAVEGFESQVKFAGKRRHLKGKVCGQTPLLKTLCSVMMALRQD